MKTYTHTPPLSRRDAKILEKRRLKAANLFRKKVKHAEIARRLGVSRVAVHQWYTAWKKKGKKGLFTPDHGLGRKPLLAASQQKTIEQTLQRGPQAFGYDTDLWTLERIAAVIWKIAHVRYHPRYPWYLMQRLGWSCQKPETRARERNERRIRYWVRHTWPRIQKKG